MADLNNNMNMTSTALTHASRLLIDSRDFDPSSITTVGNPSLIQGSASSFSLTSYFRKDELNLSNASEFTINMRSIYLDDMESQLMFAMVSTDSKYSIKCTTTTDSINILINDSIVATVKLKTLDPVTLEEKDSSFTKEDEINIKLNITSTLVDFLVFVNSDIYQVSAEGDFSKIIPNVFSLYVGADPNSSELYWSGTIDLKELILKVDKVEFYSTGILKGYTFTKLIVSDNSVTLTDSTSELLGHVVECPITEVVRTGNNILLTSTLGSDIAINIQQAGLYCSDGEKTILFSEISNLSIKKDGSLGYQLILHVKLDVNVVNVSVSPIISIEDEDSIVMTNFEIVKRDYVYMTSNLERMIKENSLGLGNYKTYMDLIDSSTKGKATKLNVDGLDEMPVKEPEETEKAEFPVKTMVDVKPSGVGYNRPQSNHKRQSEYNELQDVYSASLGYSKVQGRGKVYTVTSFTDENITKVGSVALSEDGEASSFGTADYLKATIEPIDNEFEIEVAFKVDSIPSGVNNIFCLKSESSVQPLTLSIENKQLRIALGQKEAISVSYNGSLYTYVRNGMSELSDSKWYYRWSGGNAKEAPRAVFTSELIPTPNMTLYDSGFEELSKLYAWTFGDEKVYTKSTEIEAGTALYNANYSYYSKEEYPKFEVTQAGETYIVSYNDGETSTAATREEASDISAASANAFMFGTIIDQSIATPKIGIKQYVKVSFDGNTYNVYVKEEDQDYTLRCTKVSPLPIGVPEGALFGIAYNANNKKYENYFRGSSTIYLKDFLEVTTDSIYSFTKTETFGGAVLQAYYHIPSSVRSYYNVHDFSNYADPYSLCIQEGALRGRNDVINLDTTEGFSLCIKAKLEDSEDKVVLAKTNINMGLTQFIFEVADNKILFSMYSTEDTVTLSKSLDTADFKRYTGYASLFTITASEVASERVTYKLYMNNELLDSISTDPVVFSSGSYQLTNYISGEETEDGEIVVSNVNDNCVSDILFFNGEISDNDRFYLCNILDTNF